MRKFTILLLLISSLSSHAETLTEVIQRTLETNPDVLITVNNRRATAQELKQVSTGGEVTLTRQELGLTLSQILFDGFSLRYRVAQQSSLLNSAAYKVQDSSENLALLTAETYLEVLRRQELVELAKDNVVIHQKTLRQIRTLVKGGAGRRADMLQSSSRLALAKSSLVNAQGNLRNAEINYRRITGELPKALTRPSRTPVETALPKTKEAALDTALNNHPSLRVAKADFEAAKAAHQQTSSAFMPHFSLELGITDMEPIGHVVKKRPSGLGPLKKGYGVSSASLKKMCCCLGTV